MKTIVIENKVSGIILGRYEADNQNEALQMFARQAGYNHVSDIPNLKMSDLTFYEFEKNEVDNEFS